jgi:molybdenum cofactor cytidylyltransferase
MIVDITAIILAAGESRRMGQPKLLLPWGKTSVLGQVVSVLSKAGIGEIVVVMGGDQELVAGEASRLEKLFPLRTIFNPGYIRGGMLSSIQCGLGSLSTQTQAALVCLGDQPQVQEKTVLALGNAFALTRSPLIVPSYRGRRGHPWLVARPLWQEILLLPVLATAREFLGSHLNSIHYLPASRTILQDLDTPEDYARQHP